VQGLKGTQISRPAMRDTKWCVIFNDIATGKNISILLDFIKFILYYNIAPKLFSPIPHY
jgi:hypothetical protein